ncbi:MAG: pentapeptide repeat-containing protein [Anaerolineae bacterium]|nr:pentapeptide repeat-containing protein [Anaerolineae bacterium]
MLHQLSRFAHLLKLTRIAQLNNRAVMLILLIMAIVASSVSLLVNVFTGDTSFAGWSESWLQNFSTEMFGAFLTFILIEIIVGGRQRRTEQEEDRVKRQAELIVAFKAASRIEDRQAIADQMNTSGVLPGADLRDLNLRNLNLRGANLQNANLEGAILTGVKLNKANLRGANLQNASLVDVDGSVADFRGTNLQNAILQYSSFYAANLEKAKLWGATLRSVNLEHANLRAVVLRCTVLIRVDLSNARLENVDLKYTVQASDVRLPDGSDTDNATDLSVFCNARHPYYRQRTEILYPT